jgi:predicted amidohydrolase YtcJ
MAAHEPETADLVLENGTIFTMNPLGPRADAVAIGRGEIMAVGTAADVRRLVGPRTRVVDLAGRAVTPGLVDGHCHLAGLGATLEEPSLRGMTKAAVLALVAAEAARRAPGEWIEAGGWDQTLWDPPEFPTRAELDAVAPKNPVALRRIDGHALWVNAAALAAAREPDAPGILVDEDMELVDDQIPAPPADVIRRRILRAQDVALAAGLTGVHEMGVDQATLDVYRSLGPALQIRVYAFLHAGDTQSTIALMDRTEPFSAGMFTLRGAKIYADGALGSRGAALIEPYADDPKNRGLVLTDEAAIAAAARDAKARGYQLAVHAIGDAANRDVLDAFAAAGVGPDDRFRVEHGQIVRPEDVARFARLGVFAAMQPPFATSDARWAPARLGPARMAYAYAWRPMLDAHVHVGGGSDFPIEDVSPLGGLRSATGALGLTLDEALGMYTVENAYGSFTEYQRGRIVPGYAADLTVYDRDLASLADTRIDMTIVGGRVVYDRTR